MRSLVPSILLLFAILVSAPPAAAHEGPFVHCDETVCVWYHQVAYNGGGCALGEDSHNYLEVYASLSVAGDTLGVHPFAGCHETHGYGKSGVGIQVSRYGSSGSSFHRVSWTGWSDENADEHYCGIHLVATPVPVVGFVWETIACPDGVRPPVATLPVLPGSDPYN